MFEGREASCKRIVSRERESWPEVISRLRKGVLSGSADGIDIARRNDEATLIEDAIDAEEQQRNSDASRPSVSSKPGFVRP